MNQSLYIIGEAQTACIVGAIIFIGSSPIPKSESNRVNTNVICSTSKLTGTAKGLQRDVVYLG